MKCLIAGASGLVGNQLLQLLLEDPRIEAICSISRRSLPVQHPKLKQIVTDFDQLEKLKGVPKSEVAFCCLGTTIKKVGSQQAFRHVDHDYVVSFAQLAMRSGVKHFLTISALGANSHSKIFYNQVKGQTEEDLEQVGFESFTAFRPSLLLGHRVEKRVFEKLAVSLFPVYRPLFIGPLAKSRPIEARTVAKAMLDKAFQSTRGKTVILNHEMIEATF